MRRPIQETAPSRAGARPPSDTVNGSVWANPVVAALALFGAVMIAYLRTRHFGFIWDDDMHLTQNPVVVGPQGLVDIWTSRAARICPLVLTTFWAEHKLWGLNPLPYHLVNVAVHAASALVLWRALKALGVRGAWFGAALWALHPVQVETVAWVTELKNTQSGLFYLLAILFFVRSAPSADGQSPPNSRRDYGWALAFSALAMASKSSTVVLPAVLALGAWWKGRRLDLRILMRLVPVAAMSLASSALAVWTQHLEGASDATWARSWPERIAVAGKVFWFYLAKLAWPHPLIFIYPRWHIDGTRVASFLPTAALGAVGLALWLRRRGTLGPLFFSFAYFLAALAPVLGIVDQFFLRYSFVGDHFQYLASMGPLALAGAGLASLPLPAGGGRAAVRGILGAGLLCALGAMTWVQSADYATTQSLWKATLARNPECWLASNNLGSLSLRAGRFGEARGYFEEALRVGPETPAADTNLGNALMKEGSLDAAIGCFRKALALDPSNAGSLENLGEALRLQGHLDEAEREFGRSLRADPALATAHSGLGNIYLQEGRLDEAAAEYQKALERDPSNTEARTNLGTVFLQKGESEAAIACYEAALKLDPRLLAAQANLGNALLRKGLLDEAIAHYLSALEIDPRSAETSNNLGYAYLEEGKVDDAVVRFRRALELNPGYAEAHRNLGRALFKKGDLDGAGEQFREAGGP